MLRGTYNYNKTLEKMITVFGSIFNNIYIARKDGQNVSNVMRVPIAFGPREKYLARIEGEGLDQKAIAIKLPRLSFELLSMTYDSTTMLNDMNKRVTGSCETDDVKVYLQSVPYDIGISLSVYGETLSDIYQIVEQILPTFTPDYTVTVKGMEGPDTLTDVPFVLNDINIEDTYEGTFDSRRTLIWTLNFTTKLRFAGAPISINCGSDSPASPSDGDNGGIGGYVTQVDLNLYDKFCNESENLEPLVVISQPEE